MSEARYLIWSFKHRQWWAPQRRGYTPYIGAAGRYNAQDAGEIVTGSIMGESACIYEAVAEDMGAPNVAGLWVEVEETP